MQVKRKIFVASSTNALEKVDYICDILEDTGNIEPLPWKALFSREAGALTLEVLENDMLAECCAAVVVFSPDQKTDIHGKQVAIPGGNVMVEFGLVAGKFGHDRVVVCKYGDAEVPTDLLALTLIDMEEPTPSRDLGPAARLRAWCSHLLAVANSLTIHHYSGRWRFVLEMNPWRNVRVEGSSFVKVEGHMYLVFEEGGRGSGMMCGNLIFQLPAGRSAPGLCRGTFLTTHEITSAFCGPDDSLRLNTRAFSLQRVTLTGDLPAELIGFDSPPMVHFEGKWVLRPGAEPMSMEGELHTIVGTRGKIVSASKEVEVA